MTLLPLKADAAVLSDTGQVSVCPEGAASFSPGQAFAPPWVSGKKASCPEGAASQTSALLSLGGHHARHGSAASPGSAFTVLELLVACSVLVIMLGFISMAISQMAKGIKTSASKVDAFQSARASMESVSRTLGIATLNTYWDYYIVSGGSYTNRGTNTNAPATYGRQSDLQFVVTNLGGGLNGMDTVTHGVFFQAPIGYSTNTNPIPPPGCLNPCGFFVAYGGDPAMAPMLTNTELSSITSKPRFRLYQWLASSENLKVDPNTGTLSNTWMGSAVLKTNVVATAVGQSFGIRPLAENIVAFVARVPATSATTATNYGWNSRTTWPSGAQPNQMHQLPPLVEITMVAVEEAAVNRLAGSAASSSDAASKLGISGLGSLFSDDTQYDADLKAVTDGLSSKGVPYRVFTATVPLRESRWSP